MSEGEGRGGVEAPGMRGGKRGIERSVKGREGVGR